MLPLSTSNMYCTPTAGAIMYTGLPACDGQCNECLPCGAEMAGLIDGREPVHQLTRSSELFLCKFFIGIP